MYVYVYVYVYAYVYVYVYMYVYVNVYVYVYVYVYVFTGQLSHITSQYSICILKHLMVLPFLVNIPLHVGPVLHPCL